MLRYLENRAKCVSTLLEAITFDSTQIFNFFSVLETRNQSFPKTPSLARVEKWEKDKIVDVSRVDSAHLVGLSA